MKICVKSRVITVHENTLVTRNMMWVCRAATWKVEHGKIVIFSAFEQSSGFIYWSCGHSVYPVFSFFLCVQHLSCFEALTKISPEDNRGGFLPFTLNGTGASSFCCCLLLIDEQRFLRGTPDPPPPPGSRPRAAGWCPAKRRHTASVTRLAGEC